MEVICLETSAFYALVEKVIEHVKEKQNIQEEKWLDTEAAMALLGIKSKTTLQDLRNKGKIKFSQPMKRVILYDRSSLLEYLEANAKETF